MAELTPDAAKAVVGLFLDAYNARHGTAYAVCAAEPPDDLSCDYLCEEAGRDSAPLKVQLTRASVTIETKAALEEAGGASVSLPMHAWLHDRVARNQPSWIEQAHSDLAVRALRAKAERLGPSASDLVLLIFFDLMRYDESMDLPEMIDSVAAETVPFREVWSVWSYEDEAGQAHCLWPAGSAA